MNVYKIVDYTIDKSNPMSIFPAGLLRLQGGGGGEPVQSTRARPSTAGASGDLGAYSSSVYVHRPVTLGTPCKF